MAELIVALILLYLWGWSLEKKAQRRRRRHGCRQKDSTNTAPTTEAQPTAIHVASPSVVRDSFGDGTYLVGIDIKPGLYRAPGVPGTQLAWARLRTVQGADHDVIAGYQGSAPGLVEILNQDFAFWSQNSGGWHLVPEGIDIHEEVGNG